MNQIIGVILMSISGAVQGIAMEYMIDKKSENSTPVGRVLYWTIWGIIMSCMNVFAENPENTQPLRQLLYWGSTLFALKFFYKDPLWRKFLAMILVFFAFTMSEFGNYFAIQIQGISVEVLKDRTSNTAILFIAIGSLLSCVSILILLVLWKKAFKKGKNLKYTWFIIVYAFVQFIYQYIMTNSIYDSNISGLEVIVVSLGMICIIVLLFTVFSQVEKQAMEEHLSEERLKNNLKRIHYEEVKKRRIQVQEIIQANKKILSEVKALIQNNKTKEAGELLESMSRRMEATKEYVYCEVPVLNALVSEKFRMCQQKGIKMNVRLNIPEIININHIDLCCVIGNMLDNAIRACGQIIEAGLDKNVAEIGLAAEMRKGYVIIKCKNPSIKAPGEKAEGTGYGLKILSDIAEKYQGNLQMKYENHVFISQISLRM